MTGRHLLRAAALTVLALAAPVRAQYYPYPVMMPAPGWGVPAQAYPAMTHSSYYPQSVPQAAPPYQAIGPLTRTPDPLLFASSASMPAKPAAKPAAAPAASKVTTTTAQKVSSEKNQQSKRQTVSKKPSTVKEWTSRFPVFGPKDKGEVVQSSTSSEPVAEDGEAITSAGGSCGPEGAVASPASFHSYAEGGPGHDDCPWAPHASCFKWLELRAGASLYLLKPYYDTNLAYVNTEVVTPVSGVNPAISSLGVNFNTDFTFAPAAWLGLSFYESGVGIRGRYFHFEQGADELGALNRPTQTLAGGATRRNTFTLPSTFPVGPGAAGIGTLFGSPSGPLTAGFGEDRLTFSSEVKVQNLDVELTKELKTSALAATFGFGGRYTQLQQGYRAHLINSVFVPVVATGGGQVTEIQEASFTHDFFGAGPTLSAELRWRLGPTGWAVYGNARGSLLVGSSQRNSFTTRRLTDPAQVLGTPAGGINVANPFFQDDDNLLPISELEAGMEYNKVLGRVVNMVLRGAVVNQTYFGIGSPSSLGGNMSLFGGQVTLGLGF